MQASFIICFHTRRIDNLLQTLRFLAQRNPALVAESEVLLMCQDRCGRIDPPGFLSRKLFNLQLPCMLKNTMINRAVREAQSENIIILDSDRILPHGYFQNLVIEPKTVVSTETMWKLSHAVSDEELESNSFHFQSENRSKENRILTRSITAGNFAMKKDDFWLCGGMDEAYSGYGFEDQDFAKQLEKNSIRFVWRPEIELHLHHEKLTYGEGDQKLMFLENALRYCKKWHEIVPEEIQTELDEYRRALI